MWTVPAFGHHSLAEYDDTRVKTIEGTLVDVRLKNPHSALIIQMDTPGGFDYCPPARYR